MRLRILGKWWTFEEVESLGDCYGDIDPPTTKGKSIRIESNLSGEKRLEVLIHEQLHAAAFEMFDEAFVKQLAKDMARNLRRCGYRRVDG